MCSERSLSQPEMAESAELRKALFKEDKKYKPSHLYYDITNVFHRLSKDTSLQWSQEIAKCVG